MHIIKIILYIRYVCWTVLGYVRKTVGFFAITGRSATEQLGHKKTRCGNQWHLAGYAQSFLVGCAVLIGCMRDSKSDGTQTLSPQRYALLGFAKLKTSR